MDLRQLEILRAVAQSGSFTSAGEQLHLSQSAVSRQILLLEEELNEQLFLQAGAQDSHHAGGNDAPRAQRADVRRPRADARGHPRHAAVGQGHAQAGRRDDGLPVRVSAAPEGVPEGAPERRGEADAGRDAAPHPAAAVGHGRPRAADAAGRRPGADERAGDARRAAARDGAAAPAGAEEAHHAAGPGAAAVRALRGRVRHPQGDRRVLRSPSTSRRRS